MKLRRTTSQPPKLNNKGSYSRQQPLNNFTILTWSQFEQTTDPWPGHKYIIKHRFTTVLTRGEGVGVGTGDGLVVLSKYQSKLIINKEVMAILAEFNNLM
ncbi:hypothetical protein DPMN_077858 [Dreissena polymorpha]|uniref:Uncharacterized protein n=1 Tax=Dreissena polymorpha TaxID=45954 RepID=A0A9D3YL82_DREPO|nr:hypothetical protein DPMN_077858 [Dreissena polymorpha]